VSKGGLARLALAAVGLTVTGCTLNRPADPVVLTGAQLPALSSVAAGDVVAFRWINGWDQVPIQVDERKDVNFTNVYNGAINANFVTTVYADPGTFTGADANGNVDADDEVVFMAKDVGPEAPSDATGPAGVVGGSGLEVKVHSSLGGADRDGWIYLFKRSGSLSPGAGESYVSYDFQLLSGAYKTTYKLQDGPNPENTTVSTPYYVDHFSDRWLNDQIKVKAGDASEVDIIDRAKALLGPGSCGRSEDTFDDAEGAFVTNKVGPVRAIRSYVGANSGPLTQREHVFYEQRQDIRTFLRVHSGIPGPMDFFDYSAAAVGMTYRNSANTGGVTIDGAPDTVAAAQLAWESVDGPQGGLSMAHALTTDIPGLVVSSFYFDDSTPGGGAETQCTGDAQAIGQSGPWVRTNPLPNTDPRTTPFNSFNSTRTIYFEEPGKAAGAARAAQVASPFQPTVSSLP
jgi:hypothetical protein